MSDIAVVTANFGGYDEPRGAVAQDTDAEWCYFTDGPEDAPEPWHTYHMTVVTETPRPRLEAKKFKLMPWSKHVIGPDWRWVVWLDANMEVTSPTFLTEALASAACSGAPVTAWKHPRRSTVADEIDGSLTEAPAKYGAMRDAFGEQHADYLRAGFPDDLGLWACGTLVWNMEPPSDPLDSTRALARNLGTAWLAECERHTIQDQVSLPFVAWEVGANVGTFPVPQIEGSLRAYGALTNRWMILWPHNRED